MVLLPATPAHATPRCASPPPPGHDAPQPSWAQLRDDRDTLASLADGHGVTVAVVDSGVDASHPQLRGRVVSGIDALDGGDGRVDCVGHGTAVASLIAGRGEAHAGLRGLAPGATILPVRVSERPLGDAVEGSRTVSPDRLAAAIRGAVDAGARVLNLSLVLYRDDARVRHAIGYAVAHDVVVVAAAGNLHEQGDPTPYPAAYDGVLGVGALGPDGLRWPASQVGPYVDLLAPGAEVTAAAAGRGYDTYSGTSFAVPYVAATAALVRQYRPGLSAAQVVARLLATADAGPGASGGYGQSVLNPYRAVTERLVEEPGRKTPPASTSRPGPAAAAVIATGRRTGTLGLVLAGVTLLLAVLVLVGAAQPNRP